jgi:hypothetical protein
VRAELQGVSPESDPAPKERPSQGYSRVWLGSLTGLINEDQAEPGPPDGVIVVDAVAEVVRPVGRGDDDPDVTPVDVCTDSGEEVLLPLRVGEGLAQSGRGVEVVRP